MQFETVIGLEVHVQLNTKTKIFCNCSTSFGEEPNTNTCPTCLALPGALPVLNMEAVKKAMLFGNAVGATINKASIFDRKSYFYPDSPKAYQISQFTIPIVEHGTLTIDFEDGSSKTVRIGRAHMEEDAGKNIHESGYSKVDLNRVGTPLVEVVSEPDMSSSLEAVLYLKKLHAIVTYLDISDANMQEGSFRCDANVSIRPVGDTSLYTRVEIKNINSFKFVQRAIDYEVARQREAWMSGVYAKEVVQETRLYDPSKNETRSMRGKEGSADYRYFPDPDLPPLIVTDEMMEEAKKLPELPDQKKDRFVNAYGLKPYDAGVLTNDLFMAGYFEDMIKEGSDTKLAVSWLTTELLGRLNSKSVELADSGIDAKKLATLTKRISDGTISGKAAKDVLDYIVENTDQEVDAAIEKLGLKQVSDDGAIIAIIEEVMKNNPQQVEGYRAGKEALFGFFVGQTMKASKGSANPAKVNDLLKQMLNG
jgi:aspartyl-tRNA(Asn)/glutamyl-tRNA(Gln) amidotransferase subunit B